LQGVEYERDGQTHRLEVDHVLSSIPITALAQSLRPSPPKELLHPVERIDYRAMILIYLVLGQERFSEYDAYYFPEPAIPVARVSEPKNFSNGQGPPNVTVLCAELPCAPDGPEWQQSDDELGVLVCRALRTAGAPVTAPIKQVATRRLRHAYPIYRRGYEDAFDPLDRWLGRIEGLLTFGRQGLFSHDNLHHALYMAYCAAVCLDDRGRFDRARWQAYRREFEAHVVED
jgi:protoporphyrinogen oxidase